MMPDGGTLLLGGLKFYEQVTEESGLPILSDIPILGFLLSRKGDYVNRRNLIILITARIVPLEELEPRSELDVPALPNTPYVPIRPIEDPGLDAAPACPPPSPQPIYTPPFGG